MTGDAHVHSGVHVFYSGESFNHSGVCELRGMLSTGEGRASYEYRGEYEREDRTYTLTAFVAFVPFKARFRATFAGLPTGRDFDLPRRTLTTQGLSLWSLNIQHRT